MFVQFWENLRAQCFFPESVGAEVFRVQILLQALGSNAELRIGWIYFQNLLISQSRSQFHTIIWIV